MGSVKLPQMLGLNSPKKDCIEAPESRLDRSRTLITLNLTLVWSSSTLALT
jgi:hypothetical protein